MTQGFSIPTGNVAVDGGGGGGGGEVVDTTTLSAITEPTTARTAALTDAGKVVEFTNATLSNYTIPNNATVPFEVGTVINIYAAGAGGVGLVAGSGVTIRNITTLAQYGESSLRYRGSDEWVQIG